jgi:hypothetical protein
MVEVALDRSDAGSVANILVGDVLVVRLLESADGEHWIVEDSGTLSVESTRSVREPGTPAPERRIRLVAMAIGRTTVRVALVGSDARVVENLAFTVEVYDPPPSRRLVRKEN